MQANNNERTWVELELVSVLVQHEVNYLNVYIFNINVWRLQ